MGLSLQNVRIAGYSIATVKTALAAFARTRSAAKLIDLASTFPLRRDGAIVFEECLDRGLIDPVAPHPLTPKGEIVARASAVKRAPLAQAQKLLCEFLRRVEALNRDPEAINCVDQIWLFGSVMRGDETVGDIDLAIETSRRPQYIDNYAALEFQIARLLAKEPALPVFKYVWSAEHWIAQRALFGAVRHPLFRGAQTDTSDLQALGAPCRLIYDRARGGEVDDPILPHHPSASLAKNASPICTATPDLTPRAIRPMDADWIAGFHATGAVSPCQIFRRWSDEALALFPHYPNALRIFADGYSLIGYPWRPRRLESGDLDGRNKIALINTVAESAGACVILRRSIDANAFIWTLAVTFEDVELFGAPADLNEVLPDIAAAAALIIAVDAERMLRRAAEEAHTPAVQIILAATKDEIINDGLVASVYRHLDDRIVQIEPKRWTGAPATVVYADPRRRRAPTG